jgi:glutathione S-transferase
MIKLYGGKRSRASIVHWYLEELGIPYEFVILDMQQGEHLQPDFLAINPIGKVPAIVDGDFKLWESGAILLYLADKYDRIIDSVETRSRLNQWILFSNSTLGQALFIEANREKEMPRVLAPLEKIFADRPFLMGSEFTVADVAVGAILAYAPSMLGLDFADYPHVKAYVQRMLERPAYQKVMSNRV